MDKFAVTSRGKRRAWKDERRSTHAKLELNRSDDYYENQTTWQRGGSNYYPNYRYKAIKRWLRKQVGRPWDKVYSELCAQFDRRTLKGREVRKTIVDLYVDLKCFTDEEGEIRTFSGYQGNHRNAIYDDFQKASGFYVHPKTQLLCYREVKNPGGYVRHFDPITFISLREGGGTFTVRNDWKGSPYTRRTLYDKKEGNVTFTSWYEYSECNSTRGPKDRFHAWFYCTETKTERVAFVPITMSDLDYYRTAVTNTTYPDSRYVGKSLDEVLLARGYEQRLRKGCMTWGKEKTLTEEKRTKAHCTQKQLEWIQRYITERQK